MGALTKYMEGKGGELAVDNKAMAAALKETADDTRTGDASGVTYLNFSGKLGKYSLGRDREDIDPEEMWIIEPMTVFRGWQCWKKSKPVDKFKWSPFASEGKKVAFEELPDHGPYNMKLGEGWKKMLGFGAVSTINTEMQIEFSTDSVSGVNAVGAVLDEVADRLVAGENFIPVVRFEKEQFTAQDQTNWKPKFVIEAWVSRESAMAFFSPDLDAFDLKALLAGKVPTAAQKKKLAA